MSRKLEQIMDLQHVLWRNLANGAFTSGPCSAGCGKSARGSGLCASCATEQLGELVGKQMAAKYAAKIRAIRQMEAAMEAKAAGTGDEEDG